MVGTKEKNINISVCMLIKILVFFLKKVFGLFTKNKNFILSPWSNFLSFEIYLLVCWSFLKNKNCNGICGI